MKKFPPIETRRLVLREFEKGDWKEIQQYASDPIVVRYLPWGPNRPGQTKSFLKLHKKDRKEKPRTQYELAVHLKSGDRLIGGCGIRIRNLEFGEADIGYCFNRRYWNKGYATEAARALVRFGFSKLKLHRIKATCYPRNKASARVLQKAGMRYEGRLRENLRQKGRWRDSFLFAVLKKDRRPSR